jgi:hypothetical protein
MKSYAVKICREADILTFADTPQAVWRREEFMAGVIFGLE